MREDHFSIIMFFFLYDGWFRKKMSLVKTFFFPVKGTTQRNRIKTTHYTLRSKAPLNGYICFFSKLKCIYITLYVKNMMLLIILALEIPNSKTKCGNRVS